MTSRQSTTAPHPSTHIITRQEIKYYIQLYIRASLRQTFLREEMEKAEQQQQVVVNNTEYIQDLIQINKRVKQKIKLYRSFILRQAYFFENILYKRATTMEEYYNLEDLDSRLDEVGRILHRRMIREQHQQQREVVSDGVRSVD